MGDPNIDRLERELLAARSEIARLRSALMVEIVDALDDQWECQRCGALAPIECNTSTIVHVGECPLVALADRVGDVVCWAISRTTSGCYTIEFTPEQHNRWSALLRREIRVDDRVLGVRGFWGTVTAVAGIHVRVLWDNGKEETYSNLPDVLSGDVQSNDK